MLQNLKNTSLILPLRKKLFEKKFATHKNVNYFRGIFESFDKANASAPKTKPSGYNNPDSAKMYKERTERIYSTDFPVLFWMTKIKDEVSKVFDFGGHIGIHYYSYQSELDFSKISNWTVCDVESVCKEGIDQARTKDTSGKLDFVTDIKHCEGYDLFLAKGSLQYLEWELHDKLRSLSKLPKYLLINTTPMHPTTKTITLNNIGTAFCPYYIRIEGDFFHGLNELGYEIVAAWHNSEKACNIAFEPDRSIDYYRGAILKLK